MIPIKRRINFIVDKENGKDDGRLRCRISWNSSRSILNFNVGYRVEHSKWSMETQRCKNNTTHGIDRVSASEINRAIQLMEQDIEDVFYKFENEEINPSKAAVKNEYNLLLEGLGEDKGIMIERVFNEYITKVSVANSWGLKYHAKVKIIKRNFCSIKPGALMTDINEDYLQSFINFMNFDLKLRTITSSRYFEHVKTFLKWADKKGYIKKEQYVNFDPIFKGLNLKDVIYLEWEELMKLYSCDLSHNKKHNIVRDIFCFCCFTGLRYSDAYKLSKEDVFTDHIEIVTNKTVDRIVIELNKYSKSLLDKYRDREGDKVFPKMSNKSMNNFIKQICKKLGFDKEIKTTYFIGNTRYEEINKKYELIGTHCGRRTFVVNALTLGIPPHVIMKWTGHSDIESMKPYMKIVDQLKRSEMDKFNR